jgi:signal transduction histidine kinase
MLFYFHVPLQSLHVAHDFGLHLFGMWVNFLMSALIIAWLVARMARAIRTRDAEIARQREDALRNERIVALGTLAAGAAHELSTPLSTMAVVLGEMAHDHRASDGALSRDIAALRTQVDVCKHTITRMVAAAGQARAEGGGAQPVIDALVGEQVAHIEQIARMLAVEGGNDVEREALQLEPDIERDEIVGRDHHQHAGGGEQHEYRELEFEAPFPPPIIDGHDQRDGGPGERQQLQGTGEGIDDEAVAEQGDRAALPQHEESGEREEEDRGPQDEFGLLLAGGDAHEQQYHGAGRQGQLGQRDRQVQGW